MLSILDIIKSNAATFYNYRTGRRVSMYPKYVFVVAISALLAIVFGKLHDNLYAGLIAVQSIIVGFAFNVLFYLSSNPIIVPNDSDALEDEAKAKKLASLANEVFYNISYFNIVAIFSIALSCIILMMNAYDLMIIPFSLGPIPRLFKSAFNTLTSIAPYTLRLILCLTFAFTIESFSTFLRIVKRMTYLFRERINLEAKV